MIDEIGDLLFGWTGDAIELGVDFLSDMAEALFEHRWARARIALFGAGLSLGALSLLVWHDRMLHSVVAPGVGILLAALAAGLVTQACGLLRTAAGGSTGHLVTFSGGAVFACAFAGIRLLGVATS